MWKHSFLEYFCLRFLDMLNIEISGNAGPKSFFLMCSNSIVLYKYTCPSTLSQIENLLCFSWGIYFKFLSWISFWSYKAIKRSRAGKTWLPCHDIAMIISWSWRNMVMPWWWHGGHVSWHGHHDSRHDRGMITMFSMIHTMIMVWSSCFPFFFVKKWIAFFVNIFSISCCHVPLYLEHLTDFRGIHASKVANKQN